MIISSSLTKDEKDKLLKVFREHKPALGWSIVDIKGTSHIFCIYKILMEKSYKPSIEQQRKLNPAKKKMVRVELLKLLKVGIIFVISDNLWVSSVYVMPKKSGITTVKNDNNELIPKNNDSLESLH